MIRQTAAASDRISVVDGVSARAFDGDWIVLDLAGGNYYGLDELGGIIWNYLADQRSLQEIATLLVPVYDALEEIILRDVVALVSELVERGLVRINA
jgi:hypothetical protein